MNDSANDGVNRRGCSPGGNLTSEKKSSGISASNFHVIRIGFSRVGSLINQPLHELGLGESSENIGPFDEDK